MDTKHWFLLVLLFPVALYSQERWTVYTPPSPDARCRATCIRAGNAMIVCGGWDADQNLNDVYKLTLTPGQERWVKVQPGGVVFPKTQDHSAIWDSVNNRMVVFAGGISIGGPPWERSDVYVLDLVPGQEAWQRLSPGGILPAPRRNHTAIYDPRSQRMVTFGGSSDSLARVLDDVQCLDLRTGQETWSDLHPQGQGPSARVGHSAEYDVADHRMIIFGGADSTGLLNDAWSLDLTFGSERWSRLNPAGVPPDPVSFIFSLYDQPNQRLLFWAWDDVYALDLRPGQEAWIKLDPPGPEPSPRNNGGAVYDPLGGRMVAFGGQSLEGYVNEARTMNLTLGSECWAVFNPKGTAPSGRSSATLIYDPANARAILFGGSGKGSSGRSDVYALDLSSPTPEWFQLYPTGPSPIGRWVHTAVCDGMNRRMVVFAGYNEDYGDFNDSWALTLTSGSEAWTCLSPSGTPPSPRDNHVAVYDSANNRMVVFGGWLLWQSYYNDTHILSLNPGSENWDSLTPQGPLPRPRRAACATYDLLHHSMLIFGGCENASRFNDVYRLSLTPGAERWDSLTTTGLLPCPRYWCSAIWDSLTRRMIVFGGWDKYGRGHNDAFAFTPSDTGGQWDSLAPLGTPPTPVDGPTAIYDPLYQRMVVFGGWIGRDPWVSRDISVLSLPLVGVEQGPINALAREPGLAVSPNPGRGWFDVKLSGYGASGVLKMFDASGRLVRSWQVSMKDDHSQTLRWNGRDNSNRLLPSGIYFLRLEAGKVSLTRKVVVIQ